MVVLIVDDELNIRQSLEGLLSEEGYSVRTCPSAEEGLIAAGNDPPDVVFLDVMLPGMDGLQALERLRTLAPRAKVVMMSGQSDLTTAVRATKLGAHNFLEKPLHPERVLLELKNLAETQTLERTIASLETRLGQDEEILGASEPIRRLRLDIDKAAPSDGRVFVYGENGTGKELVARAIHRQSPRRNKPFVTLNCAALPSALVESELFGYEKGAFTGAVQRKPGLFETADGGTLFLDEVGDMGLDTQAKLLRVLQENEAVRIGGSVPYRFNVRVISATNKNIREEIRLGRFREDLWYRLNVVPLTVPPLRERRGDILILATHFLKSLCERSGKGMKVFSDEAIGLLRSYAWPGNVRELKNLVERLVIMSANPTIGASEVDEGLPHAPASGPDLRPAPGAADGSSLREHLERFERDLLKKEFDAASGNVAAMARQLKTDRANLYRKLKQYGMK